MKTLKKISVVLALVLTIFTGLSAATQQERDALMALYNSTDGDNWSDNSNWNTGDPCTDSWYGVICQDDNVIVVDMSNNQLSGSIPAELGNLTNLIEFSSIYNQLSGSIPAELGNLTNLTTLLLFNNQLSGSIPAELGNLANLRGLTLFNNQLSGSIPAELGNLTNLIFLELYENCSLYSDDIDVQQFIDDVENGGTYQYILDTNSYDCDNADPALAPVIMYLLN